MLFLRNPGLDYERLIVPWSVLHVHSHHSGEGPGIGFHLIPVCIVDDFLFFFFRSWGLGHTQQYSGGHTYVVSWGLCQASAVPFVLYLQHGFLSFIEGTSK